MSNDVTPKTRVALPIAALATVVGAIIFGSWTVSRAFTVSEQSSARNTEQLRDLKESQDRIESKMDSMEVRLIRLEFKVDPAERPR